MSYRYCGTGFHPNKCSYACVTNFSFNENGTAQMAKIYTVVKNFHIRTHKHAFTHTHTHACMHMRTHKRTSTCVRECEQRQTQKYIYTYCFFHTEKNVNPHRCVVDGLVRSNKLLPSDDTACNLISHMCC